MHGFVRGFPSVFATAVLVMSFTVVGVTRTVDDYYRVGNISNRRFHRSFGNSNTGRRKHDGTYRTNAERVAAILVARDPDTERIELIFFFFSTPNVGLVHYNTPLIISSVRRPL